MKARSIALLLCIFLRSGVVAGQQTGDFCDAIKTIMQDAPNKFRNIRGNLINAGSSATIWACGITVPGTINSRFVASMGLFYEGAFMQTKNKEEVEAVYNKYRRTLSDCFSPEGYTVTLQDNFFPGMQDYKKVVLMPPVKAQTTGGPPPHITMEATYSKQAGFYTVVMYIFEH
jgi:hypothetical protein